MYRLILAVAAMLYGLALGANAVRGEEAHVTEVKKYVAANVCAVAGRQDRHRRRQGAERKKCGLAEADILKLDKEWLAQLRRTAKPLIDSLMKTPLSAFLAAEEGGVEGLPHRNLRHG